VQCGADEHKKEHTATKAKIAARRSGLARSPGFQFGTFADMQAWAEGKLVATKEEFGAVDYVGYELPSGWAETSPQSKERK